MSSIFIQIGSYHDLELPETIKDFLEKSSGKNYIHFGVHNCFYNNLQFNENELRKKLDSFGKKYKLSIAHSQFPNNIGVGISRYIANQFYENEDYYLQIDSHMMVIRNWDTVCIDYIEKAVKNGIQKPVISFPTNSYSVDDSGFRIPHSEVSSKFFNDININVQKEILQEFDLLRTTYGLSSPGNELDRIFDQFFNVSINNNNLSKLFEFIYVNGAFIFSHGHLSKIKPNKKILYLGDEVVHSCRLYTHGYTILRSQFKNIALHLVRSKPGIVGGSWTKDRRRVPYEDFLLQKEGSVDKNLTNIWEYLFEETSKEIRRLFIARPKDDQSLGVERDIQDIIDSIFD